MSLPLLEGRRVVVVFRFDFLDDALVPADQPGLAAVAVGTFASEPDRRVGFFAAVAVSESGNRFNDQFGCFQAGMADAEVVPAFLKIIRHDSGNFTDLKDDLADPF